MGARRARAEETDPGVRTPRLPGGGSAFADPEANGEGAGRSERRVLLRDRAGCRRDPAAAGAGDVRVLACRRLVGTHPRAEANRAPLPSVGALCRAGRAPAQLT